MAQAVVDWTSHLRNSLEVLRSVDTEEQVDICFFVRVVFFELLDVSVGSVQNLVTLGC